MVAGDDDIATSNVTVTACTASSSSCEEPLMQRAEYESLDLSSLGPFVAILDIQSIEKPAHGSTSNQGGQSSNAQYVRSSRDQAQQGGVYGTDAYKRVSSDRSTAWWDVSLSSGVEIK